MNEVIQAIAIGLIVLIGFSSCQLAIDIWRHYIK